MYRLVGTIEIRQETNMNKGQATRESLVQAAAKLARIKGFDRTSVQEVMAEAGAGKGSFYHHLRARTRWG